MQRTVKGYVASKYVIDIRKTDLYHVLKQFLDEIDVALFFAGRVDYIPVTVVIDKTYMAQLKLYGIRAVLTSFTPTPELERGKLVDIHFVDVGKPVYKTITVLGYDVVSYTPLVFQIHGVELRLILPRARSDIKEAFAAESTLAEVDTRAVDTVLSEIEHVTDIVQKYRDAAFSLTTSEVTLYMLYTGAAKPVKTRFVYDTVKVGDKEVPVLKTYIREEHFVKKTPVLILVARQGQAVELRDLFLK